MPTFTAADFARTSHLIVTVPEAALLVGVKPSTIRTWVQRGYLQRAGRVGKNAVYRVSDLHRCNEARRATLREQLRPADRGLLV